MKEKESTRNSGCPAPKKATLPFVMLLWSYFMHHAPRSALLVITFAFATMSCNLCTASGVGSLTLVKLKFRENLHCSNPLNCRQTNYKGFKS